MIYHVTLHTVTSKEKRGQSLTSAIEGKQALDSVVDWIQRARQRRCAEPMIHWVTLDGERWCLAPADLVGEIEVCAQPERVSVTGREADTGNNVKFK